jgi:hypothetical protein
MRLDLKLADKAAKALGVKTRTEAIHEALAMVVATQEFKKILLDNSGKHSFDGVDE